MTDWHGYFGVENIALTNAQRSTLITALRALGKQDDPSPAKINHWRARLDNNAAIIEAEFTDVELTTQALRQYVANVYGIAVNQIAAATTQTQYGPLVTLSRSGTDRVRFVLFGGVGSTWEQSRQAVQAYIFANQVAWEGPPDPVSVPTVTVLGRAVKVYDPQYAPTALVIKASKSLANLFKRT